MPEVVSTLDDLCKVAPYGFLPSRFSSLQALPIPAEAENAASPKIGIDLVRYFVVRQIGSISTPMECLGELQQPDVLMHAYNLALHLEEPCLRLWKRRQRVQKVVGDHSGDQTWYRTRQREFFRPLAEHIALPKYSSRTT